MSDRNSIVDHQSRRIATPIATNCDAAFNIWQSHDINSGVWRAWRPVGYNIVAGKDEVWRVSQKKR